jgi:hypothetical protein
VLLTLQGNNRWLSFNGSADVVTDKSIKDSLWSEGLKVRETYLCSVLVQINEEDSLLFFLNFFLQPYFPKGKEDPELSFIHITPKFGEYWDFSGLQGLRFYWEAGSLKPNFIVYLSLILVCIGKGFLTGTKMNPEAAGKHAKVELTSQAAH